jgi:hypothetical protein
MDHQHPDPGTSPRPTAPAVCPPPGVSTCQPRVAVVGGSLTGPVAPQLLIHAGFDRVAVYEAVPATASQGGGLISLEHSALDVLDRLSIPQEEFVKFDSPGSPRPASTPARCPSTGATFPTGGCT